MSIGIMLRDIIQSLFKRPVTERYPFVRTAAPERLRGKLIYDPSKCTSCQLCVKDCPANAIELMVVDKVNKRFVLKFHEDRCTFCAQCEVNCRMKCLSMSNEQWEMAARTREPFTVYYGRDEDIQILLERTAQAEAVADCPAE